MIRVVLARLAQMAFVMAGISILVFLIFFATPGTDPAARIAGLALQQPVHDLDRQGQVAPGIDDHLQQPDRRIGIARSVVTAALQPVRDGAYHPRIQPLVKGMHAAVLRLERVVDGNAVLLDGRLRASGGDKRRQQQGHDGGAVGAQGNP